MIEKSLECDIVTDLLPLYLEGKTGAESHEFIQKHIRDCEECRKNLEYMDASYEELMGKRKIRKVVRPFQKTKGRIFISMYLLALVFFWIYIILFLFP